MVVRIMTLLIPIPKWDSYNLAILVTCSIGCSNIASHIHSRWLAKSAINPLVVHVIIKFLLIIWALFIYPWHFFNSSIGVNLFSIFPAILGAFIVLRIEMNLFRTR